MFDLCDFKHFSVSVFIKLMYKQKEIEHVFDVHFVLEKNKKLKNDQN